MRIKTRKTRDERGAHARCAQEARRQANRSCDRGGTLRGTRRDARQRRWSASKCCVVAYLEIEMGSSSSDAASACEPDGEGESKSEVPSACSGSELPDRLGE